MLLAERDRRRRSRLVRSTHRTRGLRRHEVGVKLKAVLGVADPGDSRRSISSTRHNAAIGQTQGHVMTATKPVSGSARRLLGQSTPPLRRLGVTHIRRTRMASAGMHDAGDAAVTPL